MTTTLTSSQLETSETPLTLFDQVSGKLRELLEQLAWDQTKVVWKIRLP